jgi:pimeloyl-ACP methyl ester carboxylesterase
MCTFDFSGCGNSDGNTISFGANEKYDIEAVIQHLMNSNGIQSYILWGRSMGAVASIKYCEMSMNTNNGVEICGLILDSPFQSLKKLIVELGAKQTELPKLFIQAFYHMIKGTL